MVSRCVLARRDEGREVGESPLEERLVMGGIRGGEVRPLTSAATVVLPVVRDWMFMDTLAEEPSGAVGLVAVTRQ